LGLYYVTLGNRYFLKLYQGLAAVGIYALAHKLGLTFTSLAWGPFATFWNAKQFEYARGPDAHRFFGTVFFYLNFVLIPAAVGVVVLTPHFLRIFATADYAPAIALVPWIVAAAIVQCWTDYLRFGIFHASRNRHLTYGTLISAVLVTLLYVWWIPREGALGAAKASFVALAVRRLGYFSAVGCFRSTFVGRFAVSSVVLAHACLVSWSLPTVAMVVKEELLSRSRLPSRFPSCSIGPRDRLARTQAQLKAMRQLFSRGSDALMPVCRTGGSRRVADL
jgi:O-antigen/teichoic acid export membrane protein